MRTLPLLAAAALALSIPALSAQETKPPEQAKPPQEMSQSQGEGVSPKVLDELVQMADRAFDAANKPPPNYTGPHPFVEWPPKAEAAKDKATASHCDNLYARANERNSELPDGCE